MKEIKERPFATEVLYVNESPRELIAVADDHYSVRYIYNPKISNQILNEFSKQLSETEKARVKQRIHSVLEDFQCKENN